ncbi:hypothetical protein P168DRAFT_317145 [Aspergillus campestris IBT 28561]|uniref:Uncharacterized protein n=1 Tax=Aspergillus campestris (strain IBT 28561) TaxID=1392248 RepID=A0A2I1D6X1_ASPC2|nr:uncharacterized protein P168DRAFT_317145 [Aspergillus campestris IBT 28561]PKY05618.1 hypothetical protein P168DRAFT_317145 [Aspergillus campestris IBT 28561]
MSPSPAPERETITIEVHGLKAKFYLNRPEEDLIPAHYLQKAEQTPSTNRPIWLFRGREDARNVNLNKWPTVDTRFRGVYKTLKKVPAQFANGIYGDSGHGQPTSSSSSTPSSRINFTDAAKAQGQVVYALLHEVMDMMRIGRRMGDASFVLRPRLFNCKLEYWTGYRERYTDGPRTAGLLCLDELPETGLVRAVVPISSTQSEAPTLPQTLTNEFKLLLSQLLIHIHHLYPPGDQIPSQEVYLISQHGPKLHLLRGIFPGYKTSRLWSGRYNQAVSASSTGANPTHHFVSTTIPESRHYAGANMERVRQELEWMALCCAAGDEEEPDARTFRVLGSREFDLEKEKRKQEKENEEIENKEKEKRKIADEEKKNLETVERPAREEVQERDAIRQSWWDWVWEEGQGDWIPEDEDDVIINGL